MTQVLISEKWKVDIDNYRNHQPFEYVEITNKETGEKRYDWKSHHSYFPNLKQAILYIIDRELHDNDSLVTFTQYITDYENLLIKYKV